MAERTYYIGSSGPFFYDDEEDLDTENLPGVKQAALTTTGTVQVNNLTVDEEDDLTIVITPSVQQLLKKAYLL